MNMNKARMNRRIDLLMVALVGVLFLAFVGFAVVTAKVRGDVVITVDDAGGATVQPAPPSPVAFVGEWSSLIDGELCVSLRLEDGTQVQCITGIPDPLLPAGRVIVTGDTGNWVALQAAFPAASTSVLREDGAVGGVGVRTYRLVNGLAAWRPHPGDYNLDARVTVQDIFDFLATTPTPEQVFEFLAGWFSGERGGR